MNTAFDQAWDVVKADTGMWDEIYAPMLAGTAGMGKLSYGKYTADFMPSSVVMESIKDMEGIGGDSDEHLHSIFEDDDEVGDHGYNVQELMESIMEHGYDPQNTPGYGGGGETMPGAGGWKSTGRPDPSFRFDTRANRNHGASDHFEGRHRALALDKLGAPYIPYMGFDSQLGDGAPSLHFPLGSEFRRDVVNAGRRHHPKGVKHPSMVDGILRPGGDPGYSLGAYMGNRGGRIMIPPSYLYGRELVPGMGRLLPVDRKGNPLDTHTHMARVPGGDRWYEKQGWKVTHDD